jgi:hypothetical protein
MDTPRSTFLRRVLGPLVRGLSGLTLVCLVACAKGAEISDDELGGVGGAGGASSTGATGDSSGDTSSASASSGSTSSSATSSTSSGSGSSSATSSSAASSGSGGSPCDADEHLCGGICSGNTPQTGCFQSVTCAACAAPPIHGSVTCSSAGLCDFTCGAGYTKSGNSCVCANECCSDSDCGNGASCDGGVCGEPPPPPCDDAACAFECGLYLCVGICLGDICTCFC